MNIDTQEFSFDPDKLRKIFDERDKRLRVDENDQYVEVKGTVFLLKILTLLKVFLEN